MKKRITFRHMDHSDSIEKFANDRLAKIEEFLSHESGPVSLELVLEPSKIHAHPRVECSVRTPHYEKFTDYEKKGLDFYAVLDHVIDTMYHELHEAKRRLVDDRKSMGRAIKENLKKEQE